MSPGTMRWIDFWVGVPLCFLVTLLYRLQRAVGLKDPRPAQRPKNVLLIQLAEMGTMVVLYPAIRKLRQLRPDARIFFLSFAEIRSSVEILGAIGRENILTIESRSLVSLLRDTLRFLYVSRRLEIDTVINFETFVRFSSLLAYLSGARKRVGFDRFNQEGVYTGSFLTHAVLYNPHIHAGHTFLDLVHALDARPEQVPLVKRPRRGDDLSIPRIEIDAEAESRLWGRLRERNGAIGPSSKLVVLNPNASKRFPMRRLPLEGYATLAAKLLDDPAVFVVVTGVADEKADADFICSRVESTRVLNLAGATSLPELLRLFDMAQVLVTNDSGPAHFACLTRVHVVVFFGPELPHRYRPLTDRCDVVYAEYTCSPCVSPYNQRLSPCNDNLCLKQLDIDEVSALVLSRLAAGAR